MARLNKKQLLHSVEQAIVNSGWTVGYSNISRRLPFRLIVSRGDTTLRILLYIWNITHGGGNRSENEYRIQITGISSFEIEPDSKTLILGYWAENDVFAGWDVTKHLSSDVESSPSMQIIRETLLKAHVDNIALYPKSNDEVVVAFSPSSIMTYIISLEDLHMAILPNEREMYNTIAANSGIIEDDDIALLPEERKRIIKKFASLQRSSDFRLRVLNAYGNRCAVCGTQLRLVDAAHIVPVRHDRSSDSTKNGLCLCALHHRAYDTGLIAILPDYRVAVNNRLLQELQTNNLAGGEDRCLRGIRPQIILPQDRIQRPTRRILKTAIEARGLVIENLSAVI